jgi:hypothetical protein
MITYCFFCEAEHETLCSDDACINKLKDVSRQRDELIAAITAWAAADDAFDRDEALPVDVHHAEVAVRIAAGIKPSCACHVLPTHRIVK